MGPFLLEGAFRLLRRVLLLALLRLRLLQEVGLPVRARLASTDEAGGLVPHWIYELEGSVHIQRHFPALPLSNNLICLEALSRSLAVYRMGFGQPRLKNLLAYLIERASAEVIRAKRGDLRIDLAPGRGRLRSAGEEAWERASCKTRGVRGKGTPSHGCLIRVPFSRSHGRPLAITTWLSRIALGNGRSKRGEQVTGQAVLQPPCDFHGPFRLMVDVVGRTKEPECTIVSAKSGEEHDARAL